MKYIPDLSSLSVIVSGIYERYISGVEHGMASKRNEKGGKSKWKTIDSFFTKPVSTETKDSSDEPISQQSLPEFESDNATASCSSVLAVTSKGKANTPPYPDMSSLHDSNLQMTEVKMQLLTSNWNDVNNYDFPARYVAFLLFKITLIV